MATTVSPTLSSPKALVLTLRDLWYFIVTAAGAYGAAWWADGHPTSTKSLVAIAVGVVPVVFRKVFPQLGEYVKEEALTVEEAVAKMEVGVIPVAPAPAPVPAAPVPAAPVVPAPTV